MGARNVMVHGFGSAAVPGSTSPARSRRSSSGPCPRPGSGLLHSPDFNARRRESHGPVLLETAISVLSVTATGSTGLPVVAWHWMDGLSFGCKP